MADGHYLEKYIKNRNISATYLPILTKFGKTAATAILRN